MGEPANGPCIFCDQECNGVDDYCYGCTKLICPDCSKNESLGPGHEPEDHTYEDTEED